jgi:DNA-directed RNA polymerase specialized sigma24 family protein
MREAVGRATTTQLLEALLAPGDEETWRLFDARYRPIISSFARRLDLDADEAAEGAPQTLVDFVRAHRAGNCQRERGRLRALIMGIARHRVLGALRDRQRRRARRANRPSCHCPATST